MILKFILRSKGYEDERYVHDDTALTDTTKNLTENQVTNVYFNYAVRTALKRNFVDSFILLHGTTVVASVKRNMLFYHDKKPQYLFILGRMLK